MKWAGPGDGSGDGEEQTDLKESSKLECMGWMCRRSKQKTGFDVWLTYHVGGDGVD